MLNIYMMNVCHINKKFKLEKNTFFSVGTDLNGRSKCCIFDKPFGEIQNQVNLEKNQNFPVFDFIEARHVIKIPFVNKAIDYKAKRIISLATLHHICTERCKEQIVQYFNFYNPNIYNENVAFIESEEFQYVIRRIS